jgi:hypothetical protein
MNDQDNHNINRENPKKSEAYKFNYDAIYAFHDKIRRTLVIQIRKDMIHDIDTYMPEPEFTENYVELRLPQRDIHRFLIPVLQPEIAKAKGKLKEKLHSLVKLLEIMLDD